MDGEYPGDSGRGGAPQHAELASSGGKLRGRVSTDAPPSGTGLEGTLSAVCESVMKNLWRTPPSPRCNLARLMFSPRFFSAATCAGHTGGRGRVQVLQVMGEPIKELAKLIGEPIKLGKRVLCPGPWACGARFRLTMATSVHSSEAHSIRYRHAATLLVCRSMLLSTD